MNVTTVIKDENELDDKVKIETYHEDISADDGRRQPYPIDNHRILEQQQQSEDNSEEQDQNVLVRAEAGIAYIIQQEHINEDGETTVAYRLADSLPDANMAMSDGYQLVAVDQYPTQSYQDGDGNVFQILYVNQDVENICQNDPKYILGPDQDHQTLQQNEKEDQEMYESYEEEEQNEEMSTLQEVNFEKPEQIETLNYSVEIKYETDIEADTDNNTLEDETTTKIDYRALVQQQNEDDERQIEEILTKIKDKKRERNQNLNMGKTYDCTQCKKVCKSLTGLKIHMLAVHCQSNACQQASPVTAEGTQPENVKKKAAILNFEICPCCGEPADTAHTIGDFKCNDCDKLFVYQISLQRHASIEHPKGEHFKCADCQKICTTKESLIEHVQFHAFKPIKCEDCGRTFSKKFHLERHMSLKGCGGGIIPKFTCRACGKTFSRKENLIEHLKTHLSTAQPVKRTFNCDHCEKTFANRNNLVVHIRSHTGERPYGCTFCEKKFPSSNALKKHQRMHTGEKPYVCPECNKTFAAKETLNRHVKTHTGVRPHTCQFCGKSFIQLNQLRAHIFHHTGENAYKCSYCDRAFNRKLRLTTHVKFMHEGAEPLPCPFKLQGCAKTFFRNEDVLRHLTVHSGERHFFCDKCRKSFTSVATLKAHQLTHRKEPPVTCHACGRAFIRQDCLVRHMRSKHRDVLEDIVASAEKKKIKKRLLQMAAEDKQVFKNNRVWSEFALTESVKELLTVLVDLNNLKDLGYPETSVDKLLEAVLKKCGHEPAPVENTDYIERMRENVKILFTIVVDEDTRDELLGNNSVEDVILHILKITKQIDEMDEQKHIKLENINPDDPPSSEKEDIKIGTDATNTMEQTSENSHEENFNKEKAQEATNLLEENSNYKDNNTDPLEETNECENNIEYSFIETLEESNRTTCFQELDEESLEETEVTADDNALYIQQNEEYTIQHNEIEKESEEREALEYGLEYKTEEMETVCLQEDDEDDFFEEQLQEDIIIEMIDD